VQRGQVRAMAVVLDEVVLRCKSFCTARTSGAAYRRCARAVNQALRITTYIPPFIREVFCMAFVPRFIDVFRVVAVQGRHACV
jgi:hypothetical protein